MIFSNLKERMSNCLEDFFIMSGMGNICINSLSEDIKSMGAKLYDNAVICQNFEFEEKSIINKELQLRKEIKHIENQIANNRCEIKTSVELDKIKGILEFQYVDYANLKKELNICLEKKNKLERQINRILKKFNKEKFKREKKKKRREKIECKLQEKLKLEESKKIKLGKQSFEEKQIQSNYADAFSVPVFNAIEGLFNVDESLFQREGNCLNLKRCMKNSVREDYKLYKNNIYGKDVINSIDIKIENSEYSFDEILEIRCLNGFYELANIKIKENLDSKAKIYITKEIENKLIENKVKLLNNTSFMYGMGDNFKRFSISDEIEYIQSEDGFFTQKISIKDVNGKFMYTYKPVLASDIKCDLKDNKYKTIIENSIGVENEISEDEYNAMIVKYEKQSIYENFNNIYELQI